MKIKGFTLIELLVVISIIGVLSTVVLGSLGDARNSAKDAKIKTEMSQLRNAAEVFAINNGNYYGTLTAGIAQDSFGECTTGTSASTVFGIDGEVIDLLRSIRDTSIGTGVSRVYCALGGSVEDSWAFAVPLYNPSGSNTGFCVDSSGSAKEVSFAMGGANTTALGGATNGVAICP